MSECPFCEYKEILFKCMRMLEDIPEQTPKPKWNEDITDEYTLLDDAISGLVCDCEELAQGRG